ncbi:MAG TPA: hypothetical protein VMW38_16455, partial [Terriglobia bacterium]|nr:hypothetical protein [Terriglobia bacterium]
MGVIYPGRRSPGTARYALGRAILAFQAKAGDWTFFEKSGGRMPPVPLRARYGRKKLAQGQRGAGARDRRPTERRP